MLSLSKHEFRDKESRFLKSRMIPRLRPCLAGGLDLEMEPAVGFAQGRLGGRGVIGLGEDEA